MNWLFFCHVTLVYYNKVMRSELLGTNFLRPFEENVLPHNLISYLGVNNLFKEVVKDNCFDYRYTSE
jgi:hypothetical protein